MADKPVMIISIDDSDHSFYALEWTIDHFIIHAKSAFKLIVLHARSTPASVFGLGGPALTEVLPLVEADLKKSAEKTIQKAKDVCAKKSVEVAQYEVIEGDPRNVLCDAVNKFHASVLVMGSHGYGAFKRAVLGSVSDYCAHHAHCSVMIVKKPKPDQQR